MSENINNLSLLPVSAEEAGEAPPVLRTKFSDQVETFEYDVISEEKFFSEIEHELVSPIIVTISPSKSGGFIVTNTSPTHLQEGSPAKGFGYHTLSTIQEVSQQYEDEYDPLLSHVSMSHHDNIPSSSFSYPDDDSYRSRGYQATEAVAKKDTDANFLLKQEPSFRTKFKIIVVAVIIFVLLGGLTFVLAMVCTRLNKKKSSEVPLLRSEVDSSGQVVSALVQVGEGVEGVGSIEDKISENKKPNTSPDSVNKEKADSRDTRRTSRSRSSSEEKPVYACKRADKAVMDKVNDALGIKEQCLELSALHKYFDKTFVGDHKNQKFVLHLKRQKDANFMSNFSNFTRITARDPMYEQRNCWSSLLLVTLMMCPINKLFVHAEDIGEFGRYEEGYPYIKTDETELLEVLNGGLDGTAFERDMGGAFEKLAQKYKEKAREYSLQGKGTKNLNSARYIHVNAIRPHKVKYNIPSVNLIAGYAEGGGGFEMIPEGGGRDGDYSPVTPPFKPQIAPGDQKKSHKFRKSVIYYTHWPQKQMIAEPGEKCLALDFFAKTTVAKTVSKMERDESRSPLKQVFDGVYDSQLFPQMPVWLYPIPSNSDTKLKWQNRMELVDKLMGKDQMRHLKPIVMSFGDWGPEMLMETRAFLERGAHVYVANTKNEPTFTEVELGKWTGIRATAVPAPKEGKVRLDTLYLKHQDRSTPVVKRDFMDVAVGVEGPIKAKRAEVGEPTPNHYSGVLNGVVLSFRNAWTYDQRANLISGGKDDMANYFTPYRQMERYERGGKEENKIPATVFVTNVDHAWTGNAKPEFSLSYAYRNHRAAVRRPPTEISLEEMVKYYPKTKADSKRVMFYQDLKDWLKNASIISESTSIHYPYRYTYKEEINGFVMQAAESEVPSTEPDKSGLPKLMIKSDLEKKVVSILGKEEITEEKLKQAFETPMLAPVDTSFKDRTPEKTDRSGWHSHITSASQSPTLKSTPVKGQDKGRDVLEYVSDKLQAFEPISPALIAFETVPKKESMEIPPIPGVNGPDVKGLVLEGFSLGPPSQTLDAPSTKYVPSSSLAIAGSETLTNNLDSSTKYSIGTPAKDSDKIILVVTDGGEKFIMVRRQRVNPQKKEMLKDQLVHDKDIYLLDEQLVQQILLNRNNPFDRNKF